MIYQLYFTGCPRQWSQFFCTNTSETILWGCPRPFAPLRAGVGLSRGPLTLPCCAPLPLVAPLPSLSSTAVTMDSPATIRQRARPHRKGCRPSLPKPTARAGRHSAAGATLRSVPSFAAYRRLFAHYACRPPPLHSGDPSGAALNPPAYSCNSDSRSTLLRPAPLLKSRPGRATETRRPARPSPPLPPDQFHFAPAPRCCAYAAFHWLPVIAAPCRPPPAYSPSGCVRISFGSYSRGCRSCRRGNVEKTTALKSAHAFPHSHTTGQPTLRSLTPCFAGRPFATVLVKATFRSTLGQAYPTSSSKTLNNPLTLAPRYALVPRRA